MLPVINIHTYTMFSTEVLSSKHIIHMFYQYFILIILLIYNGHMKVFVLQKRLVPLIAIYNFVLSCQLSISTDYKEIILLLIYKTFKVSFT